MPRRSSDLHARRRRTHLLDRSGLVERANAGLEKAWRTGIADRPSLEPQALWAKALRCAPAAGESGGRDAEEVADFRLRLEILCASLQSEAALNPLGLTIAHGQLTRVICQRLRLGALWQRRPELATQPVAPPILVVGHMRGGTTRIHRLLAADPALAATRFCDSWNPLPEWPDRRAMRTRLALAGMRLLNPWIDSIHPFGSTRADEELGWLAAALDHAAYEAQWRIPGYVAFSEARDPAPVYREFARILATDAAHHRNELRPRVMKVPQFSEDLDTLLHQFPDARVVVARRDSDEVLASTLSFIANQMTIQTDDADIDWIEKEWRRKIALRETRTATALAGFDGRVVELDYHTLNTRWQAEMKRAYQALDLAFDAEVLAAMHAEQRRAARTRHHGHGESYRQLSQA